MIVHILQHEPYENPGEVGTRLERKGASLKVVRLYAGDPLPGAAEADRLVVMGGSMSVNDEAGHPWLRSEKRLIAEVIGRGGSVLGICLGAQLIASALGAAVTRNRQHEIGWFPIARTDQAAGHPLGSCFPAETEVFHWHGETFALPRGAIHLARSAACENQAFAMGGRVLALQFHLEVNPALVAGFVENGREELIPGAFVQAEAAVLAVPPYRLAPMHSLLDAVLDRLFGTD